MGLASAYSSSTPISVLILLVLAIATAALSSSWSGVSISVFDIVETSPRLSTGFVATGSPLVSTNVSSFSFCSVHLGVDGELISDPVWSSRRISLEAEVSPLHTENPSCGSACWSGLDYSDSISAGMLFIPVSWSGRLRLADSPSSRQASCSAMSSP